MMMKKKEKYLYNKIMFGKKRKIREVGSIDLNVYLDKSSTFLSIFAFLTLDSFFSVSDILSEADNIQCFCVALTCSDPSSPASKKPHSSVSSRPTSWLPRGRPTTTLKNQRRRKPGTDQLIDVPGIWTFKGLLIFDADMSCLTSLREGSDSSLQNQIQDVERHKCVIINVRVDIFLYILLFQIL